MRFPRMTTRRWMGVVAGGAFGCALVVLLMERRERFSRMASQHSGIFPPIAYADLLVTPQSEQKRLTDWSGRVMVWHADLATKYRYATRHPWLPVLPDPPEPERPKPLSAGR